MKNEIGITLIKLILIAVIIIGVIIFIVANNQYNIVADIEWGSKPSDEYYELLAASFDGKLLGNGTGTLSKESFDKLGKDVKKANGKWFKRSDSNFMSKVLYDDDVEMVTLTDGENVAIFRFRNGDNSVSYNFLDEEWLKIYNLTDLNLLEGYKIAIE